MNKKFITLLAVFSLVFFPTQVAHGQMMGNPQVSTTPSVQDIQDIQAGQSLLNKFQNKQVTCRQLKDDDFEKIGEFLMNQSFGNNTNAHIQMNDNMKQMMGESGEEQMHIRLAKNATGCTTNEQGGVNNMMSWGNFGMMGWNSGFVILPFLIQLIVFVDLVLVGIWLWERISSKK